MNWLGIIIFVAIGIFAVSQLVGFIKDIKERKATKNGTKNENGEDNNSNEN